jgi:hypothetical protein
VAASSSLKSPSEIKRTDLHRNIKMVACTMAEPVVDKSTPWHKENRSLGGTMNYNFISMLVPPSGDESAIMVNLGQDRFFGLWQQEVWWFHHPLKTNQPICIPVKRTGPLG